MKWTTEKPTEPGFYWYQYPSTEGMPPHKDICEVRQFDINENTFQYGSATLWAGPIEEPEDD